MNEFLDTSNISKDEVVNHKYQLTPTKTWREYFTRRFLHSNLYTCWFKNDMDVNDSDSIVNSVTVVNALLLTIPFNLLGAYNQCNDIISRIIN